MMIPPKPITRASHPSLYPPPIVRAPEEAVRTLAYRRAGSAVAWVMFDLCPESVSLIERPKLPKKVDNRRVAEHYATAELCGHEAARRHQPKHAHWAEGETRIAELLLRHWTRSYPELATYVQRIRLNARKLAQDTVFWCKVQIIAGELLMQVRLDGAVVREVCRVVDETVRS